MSIVWTESFVGWSTPVGIYQSPGGAHPPAVGDGPNGQNTYELYDPGFTLPVPLDATPATVGIGVRIKQVTAGYAGMGLYDTGNEQIHVGTDVVGRVQVFRGATLLGESAPGTIIFGVWYYITLDATIDGAAGSAVVKVNGATVVNVAGVNTQQTANAYATTVLFRGGDAIFCDLYITDDVVAGAEPVATIGDVRIVALRPSGAGSYAAFAPSAGANWQNVDDAPGPDDDATYNASNNPTDLDSFVTPGLGAVVATTIPAVFVKSYARKDDAGVRTLAGFVKLGAATEAAAGTPLSAGYAWQADKFTLDPDGNPWTKANVNAAEFGYDLIA